MVRSAIAPAQRLDRAMGVQVHMVQISVLIPQRNAAAALARQLPEVCSTLSQIARDYEVIVIDDASASASRAVLENLVGDLPCSRVIKLDPACGLSAALTAGLAAATGQLVVTLPAGEAPVEPLIQQMLEALVRSDLVVGRPTRHGWRKALHRLARIPRWLLLGLEVRDPECLVWAARREAIVGLQLPRGMYRYLATLVAARGFRVGEVTVPTPGRSTCLCDGMANPLDLMAAWWFKCRWQQYDRIEVVEPAGAAVAADTIRKAA